MKKKKRWKRAALSGAFAVLAGGWMGGGGMGNNSWIDGRILCGGSGRCGTAQAAANFPLLHWLPLSFKRRIVQGALELPSAGSTLTFSNLGAVSLSPALQGCVASLEATFLPKPGAPYTCTVITAGDDLRMTLLRTTRQAILEPQLEALFGAQNLMYWTKPQP